MSRRAALITLALLAAVLAGCRYERSGGHRKLETPIPLEIAEGPLVVRDGWVRVEATRIDSIWSITARAPNLCWAVRLDESGEVGERSIAALTSLDGSHDAGCLQQIRRERFEIDFTGKPLDVYARVIRAHEPNAEPPYQLLETFEPIER